jgi:hypothetical protein
VRALGRGCLAPLDVCRDERDDHERSGAEGSFDPSGRRPGPSSSHWYVRDAGDVGGFETATLWNQTVRLGGQTLMIPSQARCSGAPHLFRLIA